MGLDIENFRPAGYTFLIEKYGLSSLPNWHTSRISKTNSHYVKTRDGNVEDVYKSQYWPGESDLDHLTFALKYDGINLAILTQLFAHIPQTSLIDFIQTSPTGKYARRIWFFYEFLTGKRLPLPDLTTGNYIDALEPNRYITLQNGDKSPRQRIINNLLGPQGFCPIVRRTDTLSKLDALDIKKRCQEIVTAYPADLVRRALGYLYSKETKSSFEIEHITPSASRIEKFMTALALAQTEDFCDKDKLIALQNRIVDPRFIDHDYRNSQNYVGQTIAYQKERVHFIAPKPDDLPNLMTGLIAAHARMKSGHIPPIIHAALIAYGFVFLHPFEDGNGRIHRFLIHNILAMHNLVPNGLMFPVSAVMVKNPTDYDASLEAFSQPLLQLIDYHLDETGKMTVLTDTAIWYHYMDMTAQAEALYAFVTKTLDEELIEELNFIASHDRTKKTIQTIIDMPDRLIDLFIQLCLQNNGTLSETKKASHFDFLSEHELAQLEQAVNEGYASLQKLAI